VRGEQSAPLVDLRMMCLDRRRAEVRALAGLLATPDAALVAAAPGAALGLTPLASCADAGALTAPVPPPEDPAAGARVIAVQAGLGTARFAGSGKVHPRARRSRWSVGEAQLRGAAGKEGS
jgi:eukaryotic-like serine/threonine-protein kinase